MICLKKCTRFGVTVFHSCVFVPSPLGSDLEMEEVRRRRKRLKEEGRRMREAHSHNMDMIQRDIDMNIYCGEVLDMEFVLDLDGNKYWIKKFRI